MPRAKVSDVYGITVELEANEATADQLGDKALAMLEKAVAIVDQRPTRRGGRDIGFGPPEEQARIRAENEERLAREKAERTCVHCGCDPDEHGGY